MNKKIKLSSASQLEQFLKILSEESIIKAHLDVASEKSRQKSFSNGIKRASSATYVKEDEEVEAKPESTTEKPAAPDAKPAAAQPAAAKPEEKTEITPTLDTLTRAIKELRSGLGVSDSAVQEKLGEYFDKLSHEEQLSLVVMLRGISTIMTEPETVDVSSLPDPTSYKISMTMEKSPDDAEPEAIQAEPEVPDAATATSKAVSGEEDTSPPIKAGQGISETYRARIKSLLASV